MKIKLIAKHFKLFVPGQGKGIQNLQFMGRVIHTLNNSGNYITTKILFNR